ncbi:hypothetical protein FOZ63_013290 [Perkinsus olseni]|uniref:Uncharacterized protein n=1 Tax=Perkinsus olseni TaxID=32597 RepID=A0A7J6R7I1_PEROL|nr:hypothetical protein FOZ63_013290 [Perkinsus olseni]
MVSNQQCSFADPFRRSVVAEMRSELQSLQKILNEQNKALRWDAVAASQRHALCSDIQEARQKQRELRIVARDLESEIRTKHRICTDMTLKLRGPQGYRSPPRRSIEKGQLVLCR